MDTKDIHHTTDDETITKSNTIYNITKKWYISVFMRTYYPRRWYDWILYLLVVYLSVWIIKYY